MSRQIVRLVAWTIGWTLFQWWAAIGWPATADEAQFALTVACAGGGLGFIGWYALQRLVKASALR